MDPNVEQTLIMRRFMENQNSLQNSPGAQSTIHKAAQPLTFGGLNAPQFGLVPTLGGGITGSAPGLNAVPADVEET